MLLGRSLDCRRVTLMGAVACLLTSQLEAVVVAQPSTPEPEPGHSIHGSAYNEGPRQDAYLMGGTGDVEFPISTDDPQAQAFFNQGVGQLHGFWFYEAERSFRRVRTIDPDCAMAAWGMALANLESKDRARRLADDATRLKEHASPRERDYIDALARYLEKDERSEQERRQEYIKALEKIIRTYPKDIEAKALLAEFLWRSKEHDLPIVSHSAVDALLEDVLDRAPMHPAHHYRIHLWDHEDPSEALASAARCGQAAPAIAHMWHMPGHIYSRLRRFSDAAWQQEASARADHAYMMRDHVLPDQIHNYAHNNEWLITNLINLGRSRDALALARNMIDLPRHPKYNSFELDGNCSCKYGRQRLMTVLETFHLWDLAVELAETDVLPPTQDRKEQARRLRLLGLAHHYQGRHHQFEDCLAHLATLRSDCEQRADELADNPTDGQVDDKSKSESDPSPKEKKATDELRAVRNVLSELEGLQRLARGDTDGATKAFAECKDLSEANRAIYAFRCGNHPRAVKILEKLARERSGEVPLVALEADLYRRMGFDRHADRAFQTLRTVASEADLDAPSLQPLRTLADRFDLPEDWRLARVAYDDVGERPDLTSLGPFRWAPFPAPSWSLPDAEGSVTALADYAGRPVIVIFYLGHGCLHCVEQLHTFAPRKDDFAAEGIELVAISSENQEDLRESQRGFSAKQLFAIRLLSDARHEVFKSYRAFDDFEGAPLHGTFLIDGAGQIRWQDIGFEPFEDVDFLLAEARRLLAILDK